MKQCSKCKIFKPLYEFGKASKEKSGLKSACKECLNKCYREYVAKNPDRRRETTRQYHRKNAEKINAYSRKWYADNAEKAKLTRLKWREENSEKYKADVHAYQQKNKEYLKERSKIWCINNRDKVNATASRHRERHPDRVRLQGAIWRQKNRDKVNASKSRRIARQKQAMPKWANQFFINEIYQLAQLRSEMSGFEWHVDHIVPIRSDLVCGLHCEHNLQVIPGIENQRKSNRTWPQMP